METLFKSIGWTELYPETLKRITFFRNAFREYFPVDTITDDELNKDVVYGFGIYGQDMVYNIYSIVQNSIIGVNNEKDADSTEDTIPDTAKMITPRVYINLFLEYVYSRVIKSKDTL